MKLQKNSRVLILSHFYKRVAESGGPPQEARDYLLRRIKHIVYIEHAFPYAKDTRSSMSIYQDGKLQKQYFTPKIFGPQIFFYVFDFLISFYFIIKTRENYELCIALDNLNTISVLFFKKIGAINKLVYYSIDYTPFRFPNKIFNKAYHFIDKIACYKADSIWILSKRMIIERSKNGVNQKLTAPYILVPMGANLDRITRLPLSKINRYQLIFVGHLLEKQGLQCILQALPKVIKKIPQLKLIIVGQGDYEQELKQLVHKLKIKQHVVFKGFIQKHEDVEKLLCKSAIGLAPYIQSQDNYTYYTDPGKPKLYMACGLPVIITDVPESAQMIGKEHAGICIPYSVKSFEKAMITLLTDNLIYKKYRENAIRLSKKYNTTSIIYQAIKQII